MRLAGHVFSHDHAGDGNLASNHRMITWPAIGRILVWYTDDRRPGRVRNREACQNIGKRARR